MPFTFSLQAVLEHREAQEELRQREYADAVNARKEVEARLEHIAEEIERWGEQVRRRQRSGLSFADRDLYETWIIDQRREAEEARGRLKKLAEEAERRRQRLVEAMRQRSMIEKLREREWETHQIDEARAEQRGFDEIAVRDYANEQRRAKDAQRAERIAP